MLESYQIVDHTGSIEVNIRFQDAINWQNEAECDFNLNDQRIDIWRIKISPNLSSLDQFFKLLKPDEMIRARGYVQKKDANRFVISRGALRWILGKYTDQSPCDVKFVISKNKKPAIFQQNIKYNVSHSGDWILIAISTNEIGIDTEEVDPMFRYKEILGDNFNKNEIDYIAHEDSVNSFFLLWTRKEALIKGTGQGLDDKLKYIPCLNGEHLTNQNVLTSLSNWLVNSFNVDDQNIASVATEATARVIKYWDINFQDLLSCLK
ncbi:4'-phosphopantetheinyl transferase family protein [Mucilaginibacter aquaedulcis]|uniref:4'-phosphopantetheinyl transferase family protein n=1 Tax=Mucilaginibacter aquaedulcis TaxID=1187081 RepID=UPI0025B4A466|nr:4'-phosphopantetheinyl transferase superfamily protein [Mucilaginibacter aquaedulcis]MDN3548283.1 4'-phosphopantetheinyl transferase superfamily protein [Mucilaginibacter aquaedulcis]